MCFALLYPSPRNLISDCFCGSNGWRAISDWTSIRKREKVARVLSVVARFIAEKAPNVIYRSKGPPFFCFPAFGDGLRSHLLLATRARPRSGLFLLFLLSSFDSSQERKQQRKVITHALPPSPSYLFCNKPEASLLPSQGRPPGDIHFQSLWNLEHLQGRSRGDEKGGLDWLETVICPGTPKREGGISAAFSLSHFDGSEDPTKISTLHQKPGPGFRDVLLTTKETTL